MYTCIQSPAIYITTYVTSSNIIDFSSNFAYNNGNKVIIGDSMEEKGKIFVPTAEQMQNAKIQCENERAKGTTKGYFKYLKRLINSYKDLRVNE